MYSRILSTNNHVSLVEVHNVSENGLYRKNGIPAIQTLRVPTTYAISMLAANNDAAEPPMHGDVERQYRRAVELLLLLMQATGFYINQYLSSSKKNVVYLRGGALEHSTVIWLWDTYIKESGDFPGIENVRLVVSSSFGAVTLSFVNAPVLFKKIHDAFYTL